MFRFHLTPEEASKDEDSSFVHVAEEIVAEEEEPKLTIEEELEQLRSIMLDTEQWENTEDEALLCESMKKYSKEALFQAIDYGENTLLHLSSMWNQVELIEYLLQLGADVNPENKMGECPIDVAMHWNHYEIAEILQHCGGKHSYQTERDIAISQRDVARGKINVAEIEKHRAEEQMLCSMKDLETMKILKERAEKAKNDYLSERRDAIQSAHEYEEKLHELTVERDFLQANVIQLKEEIRVIENTKNNAVVGWEMSQQQALDTEALRQEAIRQELDALQMRDQALQERDAAREVMNRTKKEQSLAMVHQVRAEKERDDMYEDMRLLEVRTKSKMDYWTEIVVNVEEERRSIHREISRQTSEVVTKNNKLLQTVDHLQSEKLSLLEKINSANTTIKHLESQQNEYKLECEKAQRECKRHVNDMRLMAAARRKEKEEWQELHDSDVHEETNAMMTAVVKLSLKMWKKVNWYYERRDQEDDEEMKQMHASLPDDFLSTNEYLTTLENEAHLVPKTRPQSPTTYECKATPISLAPLEIETRIPKSLTKGKLEDASDNTTPVIQNNITQVRMQKVAYSKWKKWCASQLNGTTKWTKPMLEMFVQSMSELVNELGTMLSKMESFSESRSKRYREFFAVQERIIHRKQAVIDRFIQHHPDPRVLENSAKFRDCLHDLSS